ncbi:hypothetical protein HNR42_003063 [Deinobacterium chartae]|uniref:Uncharacterized protein n=1 Tax=Deinobacterium chartae TaxID=521158 RepID=A0A841I592_9DEIO|nr:hypothetical protein [Deinobacterium chartae]MBB6099610.1 hypothetical protein [Deinobacterium chartae]
MTRTASALLTALSLAALPLLSPPAHAHAEPVQVVANLSLEAEATPLQLGLVGQTSTLPVRGAVVEVRLYPEDDAWRRRLEQGGGTVSTTDLSILPGNALDTVHLEEVRTADYRGRLRPLEAGRYVLAVLDTTFKGETALAARAFEVSPGRSSALVTALLPKTQTPTSYLVWALIGLAVPALIVLGVVFVGRPDRRAKPESDH